MGWIVLLSLVKGVILVTMVLLMAAAAVYTERRVAGAIQDRIGPNRVGPKGLLQPFADVIKLFMKEDIVPRAADKFFHGIAPIISLGVGIAVLTVFPFAGYITVTPEAAKAIADFLPFTALQDVPSRVYIGLAPDVNIGILFVLALTSVGVYGLALAGWSSNNKYSLMGGLRSSAQMISYELAMGLSIVGVILISGSFSLYDIVVDQSSWGGWRWNVILQPLGFLIFLVSAFAETNRHPFDLPEAEPELVGGFNTEYSGMRFGMFFLAEYANMATSATLIALLYFGGWALPFEPELIGLTVGSWQLAIIQFAWLAAKVAFFVFFFIWVRWSIPRFRYDQLMDLGWKVMLPLALLNVVLTAIGVMIFK